MGAEGSLGGPMYRVDLEEVLVAAVGFVMDREWVPKASVVAGMPMAANTATAALQRKIMVAIKGLRCREAFNWWHRL